MSKLESSIGLFRGIEPRAEILDEICVDAALNMASNSNNEGVDGQLSFLRQVCGMSDEDIEEALREQISSEVE